VLTRWSQALTVANLATAMAQGLVTASTTAPDVTQVGKVWLVLNGSGNVVGMKISNGSQWTSYAMMVEDLMVVGEDGTIQLKNGVVSAPNIKATSDLWTKILAVAGNATIGGNLLVNGAVTAPKITASNELWAKLATFAKVTTDMLIAGGARITGELLADVITLATRLVAGDVEINSSGFHVYRANLDGQRLEAIRLGVNGSSDYLQIQASDASTIASISDEGGASFASVDAGDSLTYRGSEMSDLLATMPLGVVARSHLAADIITRADWSLVTFLTFQGLPSRTYRATLILTQGKEAVGLRIGVRRRYDAIVDIQSGYQQMFYPAFPDNGKPLTSMMSYEFTTGDDFDPGGVITIIWGAQALHDSAGVRIMTNGSSQDTAASTYAVVEDIGPAMDATNVAGMVAASGTSTSSAVKRTKTVNASWGRSFTISGAYTDSLAPYVVQGGLWTARMGLIGFPSIISDLSGATVNRIEIYLYFRHWYYNAGGTAGIGYHGATSAPNSWTGSTASIQKAGIPNPGGVWITLPSSTYSSWKSGAYRGITLRAPGDSTNLQYYGYADWSKCKLRYTYTK
jgi:hypothetical protein